MAQAIQFQPDVQARFDAWARDPRNAAVINASKRPGHEFDMAYAPYTAALKAGVISPQDFQNATDNNEQLAPDATGYVQAHQGVPTAAKLALGGIGVLSGLGIAGALGGGGAAAAAAPIGPGLTSGVVNSTMLPAVASTSKSWLAPLIGSGLSTAGNVAGAVIAAKGNSDAAKLQAEATDKALAAAKEEQTYKRGQYASYLSRLQPYDTSAAPSLTRLQSLLSPSMITGAAR